MRSKGQIRILWQIRIRWQIRILGVYDQSSNPGSPQHSGQRAVHRREQLVDGARAATAYAVRGQPIGDPHQEARQAFDRPA